MKHLYLFAFLALYGASAAQTTVYVRNNTWNDFSIEVAQSGYQMNTSDWSRLLTTFPKWNVDDEAVFELERTSTSIPTGDTTLCDIYLVAGTDTVTLRLRLQGGTAGSAMQFSASAPGAADAWYSDDAFHQIQTTLAGKNVIVKYKADNTDSGFSRDVRFVIHDDPIYEIPQEDFQNPNVLNLMAYNVQMIPLGISGMQFASLRGALLPAQLSPYQDAVIFCEIFDDTAREAYLIPAMEAAGFQHRTSILNVSPGGLPWNGGVIIFSRWPIEYSAEWDYTLCGQAAADCLSNKGVKYARINKLGKKYHIFGTHMDAGGGQDDILARLSAMREIRNFIAAQDIPQDEAVLYGGDFNIDPFDNEYLNMLDTLHPVVPNPIGYTNSTFSGGVGKIIDHVWGSGLHLIPLVATNEVITPRSIEDTMWTISEFSDHRAVLGRFVYPDLTKTGVDEPLCPGNAVVLSLPSNDALAFQWIKNGNAISGQETALFEILNPQIADTGHYGCNVQYSVTFGDDANNVLNQYFFPSGPLAFNAHYTLDFGKVSHDCGTGIALESRALEFSIYPNPNEGSFSILLNFVQKNTSLTLFSSIGEAVYTTSIQQGTTQMQFPQLPAGLYSAVLKNEGGQFTQRILIQ